MKKLIGILSTVFLITFVAGTFSACESTKIPKFEKNGVFSKDKEAAETSTSVAEPETLKLPAYDDTDEDEPEVTAKIDKNGKITELYNDDGTKKTNKELRKEKRAAKKAARKEKKVAKKEAEIAKKEEKRAAKSKAVSADKAAEEKTKEVKEAEKKAQKEADAKAKAAAKEEKNKNFAGWNDAEFFSFEKVKGIIKFKVVPSHGTFNIAVLDENGKSHPVLTTANEYTSTSFYLRVNGRIVKLNEDFGVRTTARKTEDGVQIAYQVSNNAFVLVDFSCFNSFEDGPEDTIKVTVTVKSIAKKKKKDFEVKAVFDTILGEVERHHFYTGERNPIRNEISMHSLTDYSWFMSKNYNGALQFILKGNDITETEQIAIANFSTLDTKFWEPDMLSYRTFDTVLSYNNSGVGIIWPKHKLAPEEFYKEVFYLSLSNTDLTPNGAYYLAQLDKQAKADAGIVEEEPEEEAAPVVTPVADRIPTGVKTPAVEKTPATPVYVEEEKPQKVKKEQLSPEYIQRLFNRIAELEDSGESVNREELKLLNAELDAILEYLRNE